MFKSVCVEVLQPSQPNGVLLSIVRLLNHVYWAGLVLQAVNWYCAHSFARNLKVFNDKQTYLQSLVHLFTGIHILVSNFILISKIRKKMSCNSSYPYIALTSFLHITFTTRWANSADDKLIKCSAFINRVNI